MRCLPCFADSTGQVEIRPQAFKFVTVQPSGQVVDGRRFLQHHLVGPTAVDIVAKIEDGSNRSLEMQWELVQALDGPSQLLQVGRHDHAAQSVGNARRALVRAVRGHLAIIPQDRKLRSCRRRQPSG